MERSDVKPPVLHKSAFRDWLVELKAEPDIWVRCPFQVSKGSVSYIKSGKSKAVDIKEFEIVTRDLHKITPHRATVWAKYIGVDSINESDATTQG